MALRWVYDNIGPFNGDRHSITLFGPGAGAASAGLLAVAPQTRDIVTKVIAQVSMQSFLNQHYIEGLAVPVLLTYPTNVLGET